MEIRFMSLLFFVISCSTSWLYLFPAAVTARKTVDKHTKHHRHGLHHISMPPAASPPSLPPAEPPGDIDSSFVYDVRSFGAVGDSVTDDTQAFKLAWEKSRLIESAILLVPVGYSFLIQSAIFLGPCANNFTFQIDGAIMPPNGPETWGQSNSKRQWLVFYRADGMTLQGGGLIDGRGEKWWDLPCKPHRGINGTTVDGPCDSPVALRFFMSSDVSVRGLKIKNSPQFHMRFDNCRNIIVDGIHVNSPSNSPNTDGIHVENTENVAIYNSIIANGDDCVSIGAGTSNVDIRNITCGPSHGISIGSLGNHNSRACVRNITVRQTSIKHSDNGVRIKTWQGGSGSVRDVTFQDLRMDTVRNPILIDQFYCLTKGCSNQTSAVFVSDVSYTNIKGTYDVRSPPMHFGCSDSVPCTNLTLSEVELLPAVVDMVLDPFCWNAYGDSQTVTIPPVACLMEGLPRSVTESDVDTC